MRCPQCQNRVLHKSGVVTRVRLKGPIEIHEDGRAMAKCHWCNTRIEFPLTLTSGAEVAEPEVFVVPTQISRS